MEGYSVTEAASVLGVPTERVWELLARGILTGAPDGERGMRVFLQARPAPAPPIEAMRAEPPREPERELSPFRELLTEFRSLTERYGQALLALGEARGEVASLRSRVDLLEARMDLRLPPASPAPPAQWVTTAETAPPPGATAPVEPVRTPDMAEAGPDEGNGERAASRRRASPRRATQVFAEALARAHDPNPAELPGTAEAAAALAALRAEAERSLDAGLPRETPAADAIEGADEEATATVGLVEERQPEVAATAPAGPAMPPATEEPTREAGAEAREAELEQRPAVAGRSSTDREADEIAEVAPVPEALDAASPEQGEPVPASAPERAAESAEEQPEVAAMPEPTSPPASDHADETGSAEVADEAATEEPTAGTWDRERYTTAIEEPDWYPEDDGPVWREEPAGAAGGPSEPPEEPTEETATDAVFEGPATSVLAVEASGPAEPAAEAEEPDLAEPAAEAEEVAPVAPSSTEAAATSEPPPSEMVGDLAQDALPGEEGGGEEPAAQPASEDELLWFGARPEPSWPAEDGAEEMEVAGGRGMPGSPELREALDALDALAGRPLLPPETPAPASATASSEPEGAVVEPARPPFIAPPDRPAASGPASRAYRRLRRIFPG